MNNVVEFWDSLGYNKYVLVLLAIFLCLHLILLIYRAILLLKSQKEVSKVSSEGVSVIITCSNMSEFLQKNLETFLQQDYPCFEVIVVDECSEDDTQYVLSELQNKYPHLKTSRIFPGTKFKRTKKLAINLGILAAQYDVLLFTEINCKPESKNWIRSMQSYFDEKTAVVIGYSNYAVGERSLDIPRYFRFLWFWRTMTLIHARRNVIGNGYNMGYRKKYYLEKRGFSGNTQEYIGYDTEMVRSLSNKGDVKVVKDKDARIIIEDSSSKMWEYDYSYYYATKRKWPLNVSLFSNMDFVVETLLYACSIYFVISDSFRECFLILIGVIFLIDLVVINICLKKIMVKKMFITSLFIGTFGFIYKWCYSISSTFTNKRWK